jgi:hypothetical protein
MATNSGSSRRRSIWPRGSGRVLEAGEFFEESKPEERSLALKGPNQYNILDYVIQAAIVIS